MLPFTHKAFLEVFRAYNEAIWPAQIVAYGLGAIAVVLMLRPRPSSGRVILGILAAMWLWTGIAYHMVYFSAINPAGYLFGGVFVLQGALLTWFAFFGRASFGLRGGFAGGLGVGMIAYALLLYPVIGALAGQSYPAIPVFGVAPCPLVIFTFGLLLLTDRARLVLLVIPALWSLVGGSAAFLLHVPQDWLLLASGLLVAVALMMERRQEGASV